MSQLVEEQDRAEVVEPDGDDDETGTNGEPAAIDDDEEENGEPEPDAEPASPGLSEKQIEQAMAKLEREAKRHRDRISEVMGEEAQMLEPCPLCEPNFAGFRFPVVPPDDVREAVRVAIGDADGIEYLRATDARLCDACNGLGNVLTGSLVPVHRTKPCGQCRGAGYVDVGGPTPVPVAPSGEQVTAPTVTNDPNDLPDVDPWGRTPDHTDYGRLPNYVR